MYKYNQSLNELPFQVDQKMGSRPNHGVVVYAVRPGGLADDNECRRLLKPTKYGPLLEEVKTKLANGVSVTFVPMHYDQPHGVTKPVELSRNVMDWERLVGLVISHAHMDL